MLDSLSIGGREDAGRALIFAGRDNAVLPRAGVSLSIAAKENDAQAFRLSIAGKEDAVRMWVHIAVAGKGGKYPTVVVVDLLSMP